MPTRPLSTLVSSALGRAPPLVRAAAAADLSVVRLLVQKPIDLNQRDPKTQQTALHVAAEKSYDLVVGELLDLRASTALQDSEGRTPLLIAAECGHLQVVQLLLGPRNRDPDRASALALRDARDFTPLLVAARQGHAAVIRALLAAGARLGDTLENRTSAGHLAAGRGHVEAVAALIEGGLNPGADTLDRVSMLHAAAVGGDAAMVSWLLARGLDPNLRTISNQATPLELAIQGGCFHAVTVLREVTAAPIAGPLAPPGASPAPPLPGAGRGGFGFGYGAAPR